MTSVVDELFPDVEFPIDHLSASSIEGFYRCPEQWRRDYIVKEKRPVSAAKLFGSTFHRAIAYNFEQKIESDQDIPLKEMPDLVAVSLDEAVEKELGYENEIDWREKARGGEMFPTTPDKVRSGVTTLVNEYHKTLAPHVHPVAVERKFEVMTSAGLPFTGRIDVETRDNQVIDLKTGKQAKQQVDLDKSIQATSYLWAREQENDPAEEFLLHTTIRTKEPKCQVLYTQRTDNELLRFEKLVDYTMGQITKLLNDPEIGPDRPWPQASPMAWWCAPGECSYFSSCAWRGGAK